MPARQSADERYAEETGRCRELMVSSARPPRHRQDCLAVSVAGQWHTRHCQLGNGQGVRITYPARCGALHRCRVS